MNGGDAPSQIYCWDYICLESYLPKPAPCLPPLWATSAYWSPLLQAWGGLEVCYQLTGASGPYFAEPEFCNNHCCTRGLHFEPLIIQKTPIISVVSMGIKVDAKLSQDPRGFSTPSTGAVLCRPLRVQKKRTQEFTLHFAVPMESQSLK